MSASFRCCSRPAPDGNRSALTGRETYRLRGLDDGVAPGGKLALDVHREDGSIDTIEVGIDLETARERQLLRAGGLLPILLGELVGGASAAKPWFASGLKKKTAARTGTTMAIIDVKAEITGNVWKILAKPGQKVEEDEPIVMLESMKMEIPVSAPEPGTVKEILVAEGDVVTEGSVVARLEV